MFGVLVAVIFPSRSQFLNVFAVTLSVLDAFDADNNIYRVYCQKSVNGHKVLHTLANFDAGERYLVFFLSI